MNSKVTTFYSYKGGSGRSMAIANVAWALATNGEKVLTIDWDLEAPGLHRYFHPFLQDPSQAISMGLVDYIWSYIGRITGSRGLTRDEIEPEHLVQELQLPVAGAGVLHFIGAGIQDDHYSDKVGQLDWGAFYGRFGGEAFLDGFMQWAKENYSHILIDSRTGVADSAGVCTMQLPDAVVMCMVYNRQSIEGTAAIARSIERNNVERGLPYKDIWVVPSRVEDRNNVTAARLHCVKLLKDVLRSNNNLAAQLRFSEIKHYPWCSFEEKLAVFEEVPGDSGSLLQAMHRLAGQIARRDIEPIEIDSALLTNFWRRAAFEDPRLAELEALSSATDGETVSKLVHWLDEALGAPNERPDWIGALGLACVKQANAFGEIETRVAEFMSDHGFELAGIAYAQDRRGYRSRFAAALEARADFLQRIGRLDEALQHARHSIKLLDSRSTSAPWKRARALERVAELTLATRGPTEALPLYEKMVSLFAEMDTHILPAAAINDAYRANRLLAEQYVRLDKHALAFDVVKKALRHAHGMRHAHRRYSPEIANLLGLSAEIGTLLYPDEAMQILIDIRSQAESLIGSTISAAILERKLAVVESGAYARRNRLDKALEAISQVETSLKASTVEPMLDETWEAQAALRLSLGEHSEAQEFLLNVIHHSSRPPSEKLCGLILQLIRHTKDARLLYDLVLKRASAEGLKVSEQSLLNSTLVQAAALLRADQKPIVQFLQDRLARAGSRSVTTGLDD